MATTLALPEPGIIPGSPETLSNDELVSIATGAFNRIKDAIPYIVELRRRFQTAPRGSANIADCQTWSEFCERHLYRTASAVRKAVAVAVNPPLPRPCPICSTEFIGKSWGRHIREEHPDRADEILGVQKSPQVAVVAPAAPAPAAPAPAVKFDLDKTVSTIIEWLTNKEKNAYLCWHFDDMVTLDARKLVPDNDNRRLLREQLVKHPSGWYLGGGTSWQLHRDVERPKVSHKKKAIDYVKNSHHASNAPKEPEPTKTFFVIQRKSDKALLSRGYSSRGDEFHDANVLYLNNVRRFPKPAKYAAVYHTPKGKFKEVELPANEWHWLRVSLSMEKVTT